MDDRCVLFDFDNTIASTESVRAIRESGRYDLLDEKSLEKVKLYKPVRELLNSLLKKNIKIGIVTNSAAGYVDKLFKHLGLEGVFHSVVTYTDVKKDGKKPSPKGILLALEKIGVKPSKTVLYIGDDYTDLIAAYHAGITPVIPSWASRKPVSMAPAIELSSKMLLKYFDDVDEYVLFAEKCASLDSAEFPRKGVYFLPLDEAANVVTLSEEMTTFCLGRYFSQKSAVTAALHDSHNLSRIIASKENGAAFIVPEYWVDMLAHVVSNGSDYLFDGEQEFDIVTVIPGKYGKDNRLERLLAALSAKISSETISFSEDIFYFKKDARSQKGLARHERHIEAERSLQLNEKYLKKIKEKRILIIDDVITTGATLARAMTLLKTAGAISSTGLVLAKTVSISEQEKNCPTCGRLMRIQRRRADGERFWGCIGYLDPVAKCSHKEDFYQKICVKCGRKMRGILNKEGTRFWSCVGYLETPKACTHTENWDERDYLN